MVKPSKTMQPESVDLTKAGRAAGKAFQEDSFRNYFARKIDLQRQQQGYLEPPPPSQPKVRFALDEEGSIRKRKRKRSSLKSVLTNLKKRHGGSDSTNSGSVEHNSDESIERSPSPMVEDAESEVNVPLSKESSQVVTVPSSLARSDLFFRGVIVMVNGYTNPDATTLKRLLHRHGGDLEVYETTRLTHIIAEQLSAAKANVYKRRKRPIPICKPSWIVDSVKHQKLLPIADYLLEDACKDKGMPSITSMLLKKVDSEVDGKRRSTDEADERQVSVPAHVLDQSATPLKLKSAPAADVSNKSVASPSNAQQSPNACSDRYINGHIRTVGTDPNFLESFFNSSRLSFIGSYKQRVSSPTAKVAVSKTKSQRYIFHIDMDCFFCAVALRNFPEYRDKPVVISHHGKKKDDDPNGPASISKESTSECATCNYEARKYGIKKGMFLGRAKQLCPNVVVLAYDFEGYEEVSEQVAGILHRYATEYGGTVEQVSCDEAYMEVYMAVESDNGPPKRLLEQLACSIREDILRETDCTATVGVAANKLLAKLATDRVKPNGYFVAEGYRELLERLNLRDLHGIGYRLEKKLSEEGLITVQDVWEIGDQAESELSRILGPGLGRKIYGFCYGRDDRPVQPAERKTIGAECNYGVRFDGPYGVDHMIEGLAREVEKRMELVDVRGTKVTLKLKQRKQGAPPPPKFLGHGSCHNLSKSCDVPNLIPTRDRSVIGNVCLNLFHSCCVPDDDVRGMGIVVSHLVFDDRRSPATQVPANTIMRWFEGRDPNTEIVLGHEKAKPGADSTEAPRLECNIAIGGQDVVVLSDSDDAGENDNNFDIDLPSMSQLDLSEVSMLPESLQKQIRAKIEKRKAEPERQEWKRDPRTKRKLMQKPRDYLIPSNKDQLMQTDMRCLLRLAAVKSSREGLRQASSGTVSLTQLECLPLAIQLQVANEVASVAELVPSKETKTSSKPSPVANGGTLTNSLLPQTCGVDQSDLNQRDNPKIDLFQVTDSTRDFYSQNVRPLGIFLNENPDADEQSIERVIEFLKLCLSENRLCDVAILLRSIYNRNDEWSGEPLQLIIKEVDTQVELIHGCHLDSFWLFN